MFIVKFLKNKSLKCELTVTPEDVLLIIITIVLRVVWAWLIPDGMWKNVIYPIVIVIYVADFPDSSGLNLLILLYRL